jgi:hypothetical protein
MKGFQENFIAGLKLHSDGYYWNINFKFVIISTESTGIRVSKIGLSLYDMGILNFVVSFTDSDLYHSFNYFNRQTYQVNMLSDLDQIFPDKLKNLFGYSYRVMYFLNFPYSIMHKGMIHGIYFYFLVEILNQQNATGHIEKYFNSLELVHNHLDDELKSKDIDFCPGTLLALRRGFGEKIAIQTYRTDAFCVLVSKEPRKSFVAFLISPFDAWTWIIFFVSLFGCTVIYVLFRRLKKFSEILRAGADYMFAIFGLFLGQGADFLNPVSLRNFFSQPMIFFVFLLGTVYQSLIIAFMFENRYGQTVKTFEDLKTSDHIIYADYYFKHVIESSENDTALFSKRFRTVQNLYDLTLMEFNESSAIITGCQNANYFYNFQSIHSNFYRLAEPIHPFFVHFVTRKSNPFAQKIQDYVLTFTEFGLMKKFADRYENFFTN